MTKNTWQVQYGKAVYYKNAFDKGNFWKRNFTSKEKAAAFLKRVNKRKDIAWSSVLKNGVALW